MNRLGNDPICTINKLSIAINIFSQYIHDAWLLLFTNCLVNMHCEVNWSVKG